MPDHSTNGQLNGGHLNNDHGAADLKFTIANGQVTAVQRVTGTTTVTVTPPANATFSVGTGKVTETITNGTTTETRTYTVDSKDATLYHLTQDTLTYDTASSSARTYGFTVSSGKVTAITEGASSSNSHTIDVSKLPGSSFSVSGNTITETRVHGNAVETIKFVTTDGSTYKIASDTESFVLAGTATTLLSVEPQDRMSFTFSGSTVTAATAIAPDGSTVSGTGGATHGNANASITKAYSVLASGYVLETITNGSQSHYEVFHDGNGDGIYTAVAHGSGTTVDLVGLQSQISSLINTLL